MKHRARIVTNRAILIGCVVAWSVGACAGRTHIAKPAEGQSVSWFLRIGPQEGAQPIVCASDKPVPCVIDGTSDNDKPIEATAVVALPPTNGHKFKGKAVLGFIGNDGYTKEINTGTEKDSILTSTTGIVRRTGRFPLLIALDETGADLQNPVHHNIEVTVTVQ